ncbi:MAG: DUF262 domain-containing protein [Gammaproteobacteria bacterium AqS3]|nr:DUF262 domain-containing protein [Gammaproteobacteria bacterium AqS3]
MGWKEITLNAENASYSLIMANDRKYSVPKFQRDYSWEEENWEDLWQSIEEVQREKAQHFMGCLVLRETGDRDLEIIDGQQRLTTLSILILAALGRLQEMIDSDNEKDENIQRMNFYQERYIGVKDALSLRTSPKLTLNRNNHKYFSSLAHWLEPVQKRNMNKSEKTMQKSFGFFAQKFAGFDSGVDIASFLESIANGLVFMLIRVKDDLDAYGVFETLNAEGVHCSTPDLLKSYLLSLLNQDQNFFDDHFDDFEEAWSEMIGQLGATQFVDFLRSHRAIEDSLEHRRDLLKKLKTSLDQPDQVFPYLEDLEFYAPVYAALQDPHDNLWDADEGRYQEAKKAIQILKAFRVRTPLSLLMAGYRHLSPADFLEFLKKIVVFSIRYHAIGNLPPNVLEPIYNRMANRLASENPQIADVIAMLRDLYPQDNEFVQNFKTRAFANRSPANAMFLLKSIERHLSNDEPPANLTIEHVLPRNPDLEWQEYFGAEHYENAMDRLGNFAILPGSQNMAHEPFSEKRKVLAESPYQINRHIASYSEWNMDKLTEHQEWLARQAAALWRISQFD